MDPNCTEEFVSSSILAFRDWFCRFSQSTCISYENVGIISDLQSDDSESYGMDFNQCQKSKMII